MQHACIKHTTSMLGPYLEEITLSSPYEENRVRIVDSFKPFSSKIPAISLKSIQTATNVLVGPAIRTIVKVAR